MHARKLPAMFCFYFFKLTGLGVLFANKLEYIKEYVGSYNQFVFLMKTDPQYWLFGLKGK